MFTNVYGSLNFFSEHIDGLVQERRNSDALAMELCLSCTKPSIWHFNNYWYDTCIFNCTCILVTIKIQVYGSKNCPIILHMLKLWYFSHVYTVCADALVSAGRQQTQYWLYDTEKLISFFEVNIIASVFTVLWNDIKYRIILFIKEIHYTVTCRYDATQYIKVMHTSLQWL